jgi:hypothetical protein
VETPFDEADDNENDGAPVVKPKSLNPFDPQTNDDDDDTRDNYAAHDIVDFAPVYRCLHIFTVLVCAII